MYASQDNPQGEPEPDPSNSVGENQQHHLNLPDGVGGPPSLPPSGMHQSTAGGVNSVPRGRAPAKEAKLVKFMYISRDSLSTGKKLTAKSDRTALSLTHEHGTQGSHNRRRRTDTQNTQSPASGSLTPRALASSSLSQVLGADATQTSPTLNEDDRMLRIHSWASGLPTDTTPTPPTLYAHASGHEGASGNSSNNSTESGSWPNARPQMSMADEPGLSYGGEAVYGDHRGQAIPYVASPAAFGQQGTPISQYYPSSSAQASYNQSYSNEASHMDPHGLQQQRIAHTSLPGQSNESPRLNPLEGDDGHPSSHRATQAPMSQHTLEQQLLPSLHTQGESSDQHASFTSNHLLSDTQHHASLQQTQLSASQLDGIEHAAHPELSDIQQHVSLQQDPLSASQVLGIEQAARQERSTSQDTQVEPTEPVYPTFQNGMECPPPVALHNNIQQYASSRQAGLGLPHAPETQQDVHQDLPVADNPQVESNEPSSSAIPDMQTQPGVGIAQQPRYGGPPVHSVIQQNAYRGDPDTRQMQGIEHAHLGGSMSQQVSTRRPLPAVPASSGTMALLQHPPIPPTSSGPWQEQRHQSRTYGPHSLTGHHTQPNYESSVPGPYGGETTLYQHRDASTFAPQAALSSLAPPGPQPAFVPTQFSNSSSQQQHRASQIPYNSLVHPYASPIPQVPPRSSRASTSSRAVSSIASGDTTPRAMSRLSVDGSEMGSLRNGESSVRKGKHRRVNKDDERDQHDRPGTDRGGASSGNHNTEPQFDFKNLMTEQFSHFQNAIVSALRTAVPPNVVVDANFERIEGRLESLTQTLVKSLEAMSKHPTRAQPSSRDSDADSNESGEETRKLQPLKPKPRPAREKVLARLVREHYNLLVDYDAPALPHQASVEAWRPEAGPCCTVEEFRLDLNSIPSTPWNKSARAVFVDSFLHSDNPEVDSIKPSRKEVERLFTSNFRNSNVRMKRQIVNGADPATIEQMKKARRARERKRKLYWRRLGAARRYNETSHHIRFIRLLGVDGMSTDESDHDNGTGRPNYRVLVKKWRHPQGTNCLRTLDGLHRDSRFRPTRRIGPGAHAHFRQTSGRPSSNPPVHGLPEVFYNPNWLKDLTAAERQDVKPQPSEPYDFSHDPFIEDLSKKNGQQYGSLNAFI